MHVRVCVFYSIHDLQRHIILGVCVIVHFSLLFPIQLFCIIITFILLLLLLYCLYHIFLTLCTHTHTRVRHSPLSHLILFRVCTFIYILLSFASHNSSVLRSRRTAMYMCVSASHVLQTICSWILIIMQARKRSESNHSWARAENWSTSAQFWYCQCFYKRESCKQSMWSGLSEMMILILYRCIAFLSPCFVYIWWMCELW